MGKLDETVAYLEDERRKLWEKVSSVERKQFLFDNSLQQLEEDVKAKTSDYEAAAKQSSKKASEYRNKSEDAKNVTNSYLQEVETKKEEIFGLHTAAEILHNTLAEVHDTCVKKCEGISGIHTEVTGKCETIGERISELESYFESLPLYAQKVEKLDEVLNKNEEYLVKTDTLYKSITVRKKEIDELYYDIIGLVEIDAESGITSKAPGKKAELETAYTELKCLSERLKISIDGISKSTEKEYVEYISRIKDEISSIIRTWESEHASIKSKIESLLPNALTAGLSHAYSVKRAAEIDESTRFTKTFNWSIIGMVFISLIPFGFSIWGLYQHRELQAVLQDMPRLVLAILPLYVPVLWVAYSTNIRIKLSKRLIEEYTHKEVLSKTYEGLAKQISELNDNDLSADLRIKLLYNMLEVSSENPGKLITDYNKSDHPLMDALDKSVKLAGAVDKLSQIPGLSRLTKTLEKRSKQLLEKEAEKAKEGFDYLDSDEEHSDRTTDGEGKDS